MKSIITLISLILIVSCLGKKTTNQILEFDKILGEENIAFLDTLVYDFENDFLKNQYPSLDIEEAYRQFLIENRDGKTSHWKDFPQRSKDKFISSDLKLEIYKYPDSVWVIKKSSF